jgi:hypothetical protein
LLLHLLWMLLQKLHLSTLLLLLLLVKHVLNCHLLLLLLRAQLLQLL